MNAHDFETIPQANGDYSREGVVECTYNLILTDEDCVPVEGSNIHLACPELEAEDVSTSFDVEAYKSCSPNDCGVEELAQGASAVLPQHQQQSPTPPNKEDHSESRRSVTESKAALTDSIVLKKLLRRPCYSCKRKGHYAIDCPMNIKESERICLKCGETGHEISSCENDYCLEDLKKIHCCVCNELGHIFCGNLIDENMPTVSCYNCGESGHSGKQCPKPLIDESGSRPPSICYKCGEEGHGARRCMKSCEPSKCNEGGQGGTLHIRPEIDNGDEQQKHKRGRKSFRNGRIKRQKWRDLVDQHEGIIQ
ncbi:hypothetical protein KSS87_019150 [Heliosperma pusillum]|nr:hypothetical protein KSS87_019150 [Heliosperma pusillum]